MLPAPVIQRLRDPSNTRVIIALSGGLDSVVLLHLAAGLKLSNLSAVHVNHHLHNEADETAIFCEALAANHQVPFQRLDVEVSSRGSIEANARRARYEAIESILLPGELLLTAHHADDQVETILFRLFRGSGEPGLSGMPQERRLGSGRLYRPLLDLSREDLQGYADREALSWREDPTNEDTGIDRNYIREVIRPAIDRRFPQAGQMILEGAARDRGLRRWMQNRLLAELIPARVRPDELKLSLLREKSAPDLERLLIAWLMDLDLPVPTAGMRQALVREILDQRSVHQESSELAFYGFKESLIVCRPLASWDPAPFPLSTRSDQAGMEITNKLVKGKGVRPGEYKVRFRSGGETIRIGRNRTLKNLFQEHDVPPWLRDRVPLICDQNELVATAALPDWGVDMLIADAFRAPPEVDGLLIECRLGDRAEGLNPR